MFKKLAAAALACALLTTPAVAQQSPDASQTQDLSLCAGAVAAVGNLDVVNYPRGATGEWGALLRRILERLNREEGVEGMTGRYAASAAKDYWREQSADQRQAAANACRERYAN